MLVNLIVIAMTLMTGFLLKFKGEKYANEHKTRKSYIIFISIVLILQSGLRNIAVGNDTFGYKWIFEQVASYSWDEIISYFIDYSTIGMARDPGYLVFQKIIHTFVSESYQIILFVIAILFFFAFGRFIYYNTSTLKQIIFAYVIYSVLFYSFFSITGHRQTIAASFLLFGYEYLKKSKYIYFVIFTLIAFTFHKSSLVFLSLLAVDKIKKPYLLLIVSIAAFPILMLFNLEYFKLLQLIIGYDEYGKYTGAGTLVFTTLLLLISIIGIIYRDYLYRISPQTQQIFKVFTLAVLFVPLTWVNPSAMRVVLYFSIFLVIFVPLIVESISAKASNLRKTIFIIAVLVLIILYTRAAWNTEYKFFWQNMPLPDHYL